MTTHMGLLVKCGVRVGAGRVGNGTSGVGDTQDLREARSAPNQAIRAGGERDTPGGERDTDGERDTQDLREARSAPNQIIQRFATSRSDHVATASGNVCTTTWR